MKANEHNFIKIIKIILANIILISLLYIVFDFVCFKKYFENTHGKTNNKILLQEYKIKWNIKNLSPFISKDALDEIIYAPYQEFNDNKFCYKKFYTRKNKKYRPIENADKEKSIVIFGCSFAYGTTLKPSETFSHLLGKITGYKIINRSLAGRSVQHMLFQLENKSFHKIVPKPDYVIYVMIPDQIRRTYIPYYGWERNVYYKVKNDKLVLKTISLNYIKSYIIGYIAGKYNYFINTNVCDKKNLDFYFLHIYQSLDNIQKYWGNDTKFILFYYYHKSLYNNKVSKDSINKYLENLKNRGVIVVDLSNISNNNYAQLKYQISKHDFHPNAQAWREITPLFVKYLQKDGYLK